MKQLFTLIFCLSLAAVFAQPIADFENFDLDSESFLNDAGEDGGFTSGDIFLPNFFDAPNNFWTGWAISNTTDITTPGFMNQYSAITAGGVDDSDTYGVSFAFSPSILHLVGEAAGEVVDGMYITNGTYAFLEMRDGGFGKIFGGVTGDDPDFFLLTIKKYYNGELSTDSINFYLADFRFEDNSEDYIVDEWTFVDLKPLGAADSLQFSLASSDVGMFGMNTPAYFCVDNIRSTNPVTTVEEVPAEELFQIYPNPSADWVQIEMDNFNEGLISIFDLQGKLVFRQILNQETQRIDLQQLAKGSYLIEASNQEQRASRLLIKQ